MGDNNYYLSNIEKGDVRFLKLIYEESNDYNRAAKYAVKIGYGIVIPQDRLERYVNTCFKKFGGDLKKRLNKLKSYNLHMIKVDNTIAVMSLYFQPVDIDGLYYIQYHSINRPFDEHMRLAKIAHNINIATNKYSDKQLEEIRALENYIPGEKCMPRALIYNILHKNIIIGYGIKVSHDFIMRYVKNRFATKNVVTIQQKFAEQGLSFVEYEDGAAILCANYQTINAPGIYNIDYNVIDVPFSEHMKLVKIAYELDDPKLDANVVKEMTAILEEKIPGEQGIPQAIIIIR